MPIQWAAEACDRRYDRTSGTLVTQLTSTPFVHTNVYCEQPYTTPDGRRIAILRYTDPSFGADAMLLAGDLRRLRVGLVRRHVKGIFNAAWSGILHCYTADKELYRVSLESLEEERLSLPIDPELVGRAGSVSPDQRYVVFSKALPKTMALGVLDLQTGRHEMIFDHPEMVNPHVQFHPVNGEDILVQLNRGSVRNADGAVEKTIGEEGCTHFLIDRHGGHHRPLPVGPPYTASSTGHSNIIAETGRVLVSTQWNRRDWSLDPRTPEGNIVSVAPGEDRPRVFRAPEHRFNHVNASRCGRYFVSDSLPGGLHGKDGQLNPWCIVIGNLETGKYRTLVSNCEAIGGGAQHTHPHPYLTADNGHVIFNGLSFFGASQVCSATVPKEFLASLD